MVRIPKFQLIECVIQNPITGILQPTNFGQQNYLQSLTGGKQVYIKGMKVYTSDMVARSPITPQNNVISAADIINACLIISTGGVLDFNLVPLIDLVTAQGTVAPNQIFPFMPRNLCQVDWTLSQVMFLNPSTTPAPFSVLFGVSWDFVPDEYDVEVGYKNISAR